LLNIPENKFFLLNKVKGLFLFLLYIIMKQNTTIILMILGFLIISSLCICTAPSMEGLDIMKTNTHVLRRGEYIDDVGYLKSEDGMYRVAIRNGELTCFVKKKRRWKKSWSMNTNGSKIMSLNNSGIIKFKTSREGKPITTPMSKRSVTGSSLVLTSYGTLELKSGTNGTGTTLFTYPVTEGFALDETDTNVQQLMGDLKTDRTNLAKRVLFNINNKITDIVPATGNNPITGNLKDGWDTWFTERGDDTDYSDVANLAAVATVNAYQDDDGNNIVTSYNLKDDILDTENVIIDGGHYKLLKNGRKLRRLQNTLDSKIKVLNQLGDSHITEKQIHLDSTIYISLVWTVIASSLVYYTLTQ
jgi:hypothetical protein